MASELSKSGYVSTSDSKLYFETEGNPDGPAILFIHGLGGTMNAYQPITPDLQEFNIVRFDWGGHGRSSTPKTTSIESYVADAESMLHACILFLHSGLLISQSCPECIEAGQCKCCRPLTGRTRRFTLRC